MEENTTTPSSNTSGNNNTKYMLIVGILVILFAAGLFVFKGNKSNSVLGSSTTPAMSNSNTNNTNVPTPTTVAMQPTNSATSAATASMFKDGTYTAEGDYKNGAGGPEKIKVTVTLKNDIITDTTAINEATDKMSVRYQNSFIDNYKPMVIGKNISTINLSVVSRSSLTSAGFNSALQAIEKQAKV